MENLKRARVVGAGEARGSVYTPAILLLAAIVGISYLGLGFIMPLRTIYARDSGSSSFEIGLMAASYLLASALCAPLIGRLVDRVGATRLLWIGLVGHALVVLCYIPVHSPLLLIALRAAEGATAAAVLPPARALVNRIAPANRQAESLGLLGASQDAGVLLGPAAGTLLASQFGYVPSFLIGGGGLLLAGVAAFFCLPSDRGVVVGMQIARSGLAGIGTFTRPLLLAYGLAWVIALPHGVMMALWSIYMLDRGASLAMIGLTYTAAALPALLFAPVAGRWSDRRGRYWPLVVSTLGIGAIYIFYGLPVSPIALLVLCIVEGVIYSMSRGGIDGLLADVTPPGEQGRVQANFTAVVAAGMLVGATASGAIYLLRPGLPFSIAGAICFLAGIALFMPRVAALVRG